MRSKILCFVMAGTLCCLLSASFSEADVVTGEEALFTTSTAPDALLLLDLSGSMKWNPPGDDLIYGSTLTCTPDSANCSGYGCSDGFCGSARTGTTYYASTTCGVADPSNCIGTNCANGFCSVSKSASTYYAHEFCDTASKEPDYPFPYYCRGAGCGRTDGFCNADMTGVTYYAHDATCTPNTSHCRRTEQWSDCRNGFCANPHSGGWRTCTTPCTSDCGVSCSTASCSVSCTSGGCAQNCSRLAIAKRSVFNILDDNNDGSITNADETALGVRLGYMRFYGCGADDTGGNYTDGCNKLIKAIGTSYSVINTAVQAEAASGGTPITSALNEAKLYLNYHKGSDNAKDCRAKFVILITDGADTFACSGDGSECDDHRYKNRRAVVAKAKALGDAGYRVFVIGFGTAMAPYLRNTLN
ncbi:MAG: VWA domain-containing protein, partial [Deltaproteobacteria bacterium]|nr:VWA domain-containing protein [Deltaproteobacteria bacterium]